MPKRLPEFSVIPLIYVPTEFQPHAVVPSLPNHSYPEDNIEFTLPLCRMNVSPPTSLISCKLWIHFHIESLVVRYQVCEAQSAPKEPSARTPFLASSLLTAASGLSGGFAVDALCDRQPTRSGLNHEMFAAGSSSYLCCLIVLFFFTGEKKKKLALCHHNVGMWTYTGLLSVVAEKSTTQNRCRSWKRRVQGQEEENNAQVA